VGASCSDCGGSLHREEQVTVGGFRKIPKQASISLGVERRWSERPLVQVIASAV
jgi:hypothetical protein